MGLQATEQPGAFRQAREQGQRVSADPAVERPFADALDREQQSQRDKFAGPERRLVMLRDVQHPVVYSGKQVGDKVFMGHGGDSGGKSVFGQTLNHCTPGPWPIQVKLAPLVSIVNYIPQTNLLACDELNPRPISFFFNIQCFYVSKPYFLESLY